MTESTADLQYPIGKYEPKEYSEALRRHWLSDIRFLPNELEMAIQNLDEYQLHTPYREGGWTVQQVVHHVADSHMNAYTRFKLGLTEDNPSIKAYDEKAWAKLPDVSKVPVNISITLLHALHRRLSSLLESINEEQWSQCSVYHPEYQKKMSLWYLLGMYAWHGKHHVAHITALKERSGW